MSKNVILTDKNGNQIAPATTATQAKYDDNNTVKDKIDELNERIDNLVTGNVIPLEVTANGTFYAPEGVDGYNPVTANVPEPSVKIVSEYDFTQAEYDLIRSMPNSDLSKNALLKGYLYNASYDASLGVVSWVNGYGYYTPNYYFNPFVNYDIEFDLGECETQVTSGTKQIFALTKNGTNGIRLVWNASNGYFQILNDSGTTNLSTYNDVSIINNAKPLIQIRWNVTTSGVTCYVFFKFNRDDDNEEIKNFGTCDFSFAYQLQIGRITSQNGLYPMQIKKIKITSYKWEIPQELTSLQNINEINEVNTTETTEETQEEVEEQQR